MSQVYNQDGLMVLLSNDEQWIKVVCEPPGFSAIAPADWQFTRTFPSEQSGPDEQLEFGVQVRAEAPEPSAFTGVWFNRLPPQPEGYPGILVSRQRVPLVSDEEFEQRLQTHAGRSGGRLEWFEPAAVLGDDIPARDFVLDLGGRKFRARVGKTEASRIAVFYGDPAPTFHRHMEDFEELAGSIAASPGR
jgi:hypothetical protein